MKVSNERAGFSSGIGAVAAAAGSAIGLGNIWRFPYTAGQNGGGAFLILYIIFVFLIGMPIMMSELMVGRRSQRNVVGAYRVLAPKHKAWQSVGWLAIVGVFLIYSFYSVVAGWTINYIVASVSGQLGSLPPDQMGTAFEQFTSHAWHPLIFQLIMVVLTAGVITFGVQKGIEKCSKILMPVLFLLLILLCVRSLTLSGASRGVEFLFKPDFSKINGGSVLSALGQALFSLSLGMGTMVTYGSYIRKQDNLMKTSYSIVSADTLIAILAGVAIFPAVFALGGSPTDGPSLVYVVLPKVFNSMPMGNLFAVLFFLLLAIAALTSTISLLEVMVSWGEEELRMSRRTATIFFTAVIFVIGAFCSLSFGPLNDFKIFGLTIFELLDKLTATYLMPIGAFALTLFVGWYCTKQDLRDELTNGGKLKGSYFNVWYFFVRYIAPVVLLGIIIAGSLGFEF
ncbi:MAG: sodium-dependent transporter [Bacteroidales bacterium]|nr:sodium-dependent transporter [Bacteroidales bacterium]